MDDQISAIVSSKEHIIIIDIDKESDEYIGYGKKFRKSSIRIAAKVRSYKPSVIYFNNSFLGEQGGEKNFAEELNKDFPTISAFEVNTSYAKINFSENVKYMIGSTIPIHIGNVDNTEKFFTGVAFPDIEIIKKSKAICSYVLSPNENEEIAFINPYNQYSEYLFENCPLTIANVFLSKYNLNIKYIRSSEVGGHFFLFSDKSNHNSPLMHLNDINVSGHHRLPIKFKSFRKIGAKLFLESNDIRIAPGYIFIINTSSVLFKTANGQIVSGSEILASELYTLLDSVSNL